MEKKYIKNYLLSYSVEEAEEIDLLSHKNSKYLLYKFNGGQKIDKAFFKVKKHCGAKKKKKKTDNV